MPWRLKGPQAGRLSGMLARLLTPPFGNVLETRIECHEAKHNTTVRCGSTTLITLQAEATTERDSPDRQQEISPSDGKIVQPGTKQWLDLDNDLRVEVRMNEAGGFRFPTLLWGIPETRTPVRLADLRALHEHGGKLWYLRHSDSTRWMACDLPALPGHEHLAILAASLKQAIGECLKPEKARGSAGSRGKKTTPTK